MRSRPRSPYCSVTRRASTSRPARSATSWACGCSCDRARRSCATRRRMLRGPNSARRRCSPGITFRTWRATGGRLSADAVRELIAPDAGPYLVSTAAIEVENTHNFGGGAVQPAERGRGRRRARSRDRAAPASRRRPAVERACRYRYAAGRTRRAVRHRVGVPVQGPRRAGRLGAGVERRAHRRGSGVAQAVRRRDAPGRHPRCCRAIRARAPHRPARRRPRSRASDSPRRSAAIRRRSTPTSSSWTCPTPPSSRARPREEGVLVSALGPRFAAPGHAPGRRRRCDRPRDRGAAPSATR